MKKTIYVDMMNETGGHMGPLGKRQTSLIRNAIKKAFPDKEITFNSGHYFCSCFVKFNDNNFVYLMTSDYRFFDQNFLIRQAKHTKDYTGGVNQNYQGFDNITVAIAIQALFNKDEKFVAQ